jgi:4-hydroxy-tetrahydrodipicolinate synthase
MPTERRLICAMATPLRADFTPHHTLLLEHGRDLLARGCDGLAVFGTSGEGPCLPVAQRRAGLESLLEAGMDPARLIVGAASASLADAIELTRHARSVGISRVLLMPPFFLREAASEEGLFRFYAAVIEAADPGLRLLLYHFPAISGVRLSLELIGRLRDAFGDVILGIKDSGGDFSQNTAGYLEAFSDLTIYTGTEVHARRVLAAGGAGTICGLANVLPQVMRRYLDATDDEAERWQALIKAVDGAICVGPFLPACKAAIALATGADDWRRVVPPLAGLDDLSFGRLRAALTEIADRHGLPVG